MIEDYLLERPQLAMVLLLVDGEVGPTKLDLGMLEWVRHQQHRALGRRHEARQGEVIGPRQAAARACNEMRPRYREMSCG